MRCSSSVWSPSKLSLLLNSARRTPGHHRRGGVWKRRDMRRDKRWQIVRQRQRSENCRLWLPPQKALIGWWTAGARTATQLLYLGPCTFKIYNRPYNIYLILLRHERLHCGAILRLYYSHWILSGHFINLFCFAEESHWERRRDRWRFEDVTKENKEGISGERGKW